MCTIYWADIYFKAPPQRTDWTGIVRWRELLWCPSVSLWMGKNLCMMNVRHTTSPLLFAVQDVGLERMANYIKSKAMASRVSGRMNPVWTFTVSRWILNLRMNGDTRFPMIDCIHHTLVNGVNNMECSWLVMDAADVENAYEPHKEFRTDNSVKSQQIWFELTFIRLSVFRP